MARSSRPTPSTTTTRHDSPPPSPLSAPSPAHSLSTADDDISSLSATPNGSQALGDASRAGTPPYKLHPDTLESDDSVTCQWDDCGIVFRHLPTLIDHIHNDHIGVHKSNYTCEWSTCPRRGLQQTSRFALISHIRSHTGEKPFTCLKPECDKSFTRSDALAKHMRLQHNISPPAPGRGGSKKRKRATDDQGGGPVPPGHPQPSPAPSSSGGGFSTFKVEPGSPSETDDRGEYFMHPPLSAMNGRSMSPSFRPHGEDDDQDGPDEIPAHLMAQFDPSTGLILGRAPAMVMYLLMKAKHRYALTQHEDLCEELKVVRQELRKEREEKEGALNAVLRSVFGAEAERVIQPITPPPGMSPEEVQAAIAGPAFNAAVGGSASAISKYPPMSITNGNGR